MPKSSRVKQAPRISNLFNHTLKIFHHQQLFGFFTCIRVVQDKGNRFQCPTVLTGLWGLYPSLCYLSYFRKRNMGTSSVCPIIVLPSKTVVGGKLEQTFSCDSENHKTHEEAGEWNGNDFVHCLVSLLCYPAHACIAGVRDLQNHALFLLWSGKKSGSWAFRPYFFCNISNVTIFHSLSPCKQVL